MLYATPIPQTLRLISPMPSDFRMRTRSEWSDRNLNGAILDGFLEGPVVDGDGALLMVDIPFGRILPMSNDCHWSLVTTYDGWPNGMKIVPGGALLVADHKRGLIAIDRSTGGFTVLADAFDGKPLYGANDLTISPRGDIFFSDQGTSGLNAPFGRVFRYRPHVGLQCVIADVPSPNGVVLSHDARTLYLAVTRANAVWRLPPDDEARATKAGLFIQLSGGTGPDGIARNAGTDGLVVAHPGIGVWAFDKRGRPKALFESDEGAYTTNLTADASKPERYYVTESLGCSILCFDLDAATIGDASTGEIS